MNQPFLEHFLVEEADDKFGQQLCISVPCEKVSEFCALQEQEVIREAASASKVPWLESSCKRIVASGSPFSASELRDNLLSILRKNAANIQDDLINLLGFDEFEFIEKLLQDQDVLLASAKRAASSEQQVHRPSGPKINLSPNSKPTQQQQLKPAQQLGKHFATEWSILDAVDELKIDSSTTSQQSYPHVYTSKKEERAGNRLALPTGTEHIDKQTYEEFIIPYAAATRTKKPAIKCLKIADMEPFARLSFPGYDTLNLMQSVVYETAYGSNENMLVSAPTGAGKTDVAVLTILKAIRDNLLSDPAASPVIALDAFKIVYIAPMKALATEIVGKFSKRLAPLKIKVREYTGDMQLTRKEIQDTQIIVSTPEKWDVITRKAHGDIDLVRLVSLLIIDEVHLLHDSRGPVLESIVARTLREVEIAQRMIRIVGLSATLPNYVDVALFLRVNPYTGMFYFDDSFRPVPLTQSFVGIKGKQAGAVAAEMNNVCFEKLVSYVAENHQVMIFVHSRNETVKTAKAMIRLALELGSSSLFVPPGSREYERAMQEVANSRHKDLKELFAKGFGVHHAGMARADRLLTERLFLNGHIKVLVCTATLAWGVNLPAHAVIIKGTQVYDSEKAEFCSLGVLDVLQIFGRAGRPQFETHGEGIIITTHNKLFHYLNAIMCQTPIESQFIKMLPDNLNAEVTLGTVANLQEAVSWLGYTYLSIRMLRNPLAYGINPKELAKDPLLHEKMRGMVKSVALNLRNCGMISFDNADKEGFMRSRNVGRLASLFYLKHETIEFFGKQMNIRLTEEELLSMVCACSEFEMIRVREDEMQELEDMISTAPLSICGDSTSTPAKVSALIQAYISRYEPASFSLQSDMNTIRQNAGRIFRAVFEIVRSQEWAQCALRALRLCQAFEQRVWPVEHPIAQFALVPENVAKVLHGRGIKDMDTLLENLDTRELAAACGQSQRIGPLLKRSVQQFPRINMEVACQPVLPSVLALSIQYTVDFSWDVKVHGAGADQWWIWIEDDQNLLLKHCELVSSTLKQIGLQRELNFYIAIDPKNPPSQLYLRAVNNRWLHAAEVVSIPLRFYSGLLLESENQPTHTDLLPLKPLPIAALADPILQSLYSKRGILFFNSVQSQAFHALYHGTNSALIGAPTGSGKTILAELAIWNALRTNPEKKVVYIAPLKALVKERLEDWKTRLEPILGISVVELTGDASPGLASLRRASLILTTPEKWDSVSRNWKSKDFVTQVSLVVLDEIHLLGSDRGHVLEMLVTRMRAIAPSVRLVGLSTAMANARDLAVWLNSSSSATKDQLAVFNFRPSVRPVPLQVFIESYADQHYCPRMAAMNKPIYTHILTLSPDRPVLIFVSSRRQTRITAQALISLCVNDDQPQRFILKKEQGDKLAELLDRVIDPIFRHSLSFGVAMHHAGMPESDRMIAEEAFSLGLVQVLVATSTVAWGVNFPAHLVIVKGTEFYDAAISGYRDLPVTDVLQMIGRAGRPQFDTSAKAVILCHDTRKYFYKKFLYEPFPIESCLHRCLTDHLNAEIVNGTVKDAASGIKLLNSSYLGIRIRANPLYYGAEGKSEELIEAYLHTLLAKSIDELVLSGCVKVTIQSNYEATRFGKIAAKYYLGHKTLRHFIDTINPDRSSLTESAYSGIYQMLHLVCWASEFDGFPLRHNEDTEIADFVRDNPALIEHDPFVKGMHSLDYTRPHTKVFALIRARCMRIPLPFIDFEIDLKLAMEQAGRILAGLAEMVRQEGFVGCFMDAIVLNQMLKQRCWLDSGLLQIPGVTADAIKVLRKSKISHLCEVLHMEDAKLRKALKDSGISNVDNVANVVKFEYPRLDANRTLKTHNGKHTLTVTLKEGRRSCFDPEYWYLLLVSERQFLAEPVLISAGKTAKFEWSGGVEKLSSTNLYILSQNHYGLDQQYSLQ